MTNKKRVTIYIDSDVWKEVKEIAWSRRESASKWVKDLIITNLVIRVGKEERISLKNPISVARAQIPTGFIDELESEKAEDVRHNMGAFVKSLPKDKKTDAEIIAKGQARLDAIRKEKGTPKQEAVKRGK